MIQLEGLAADLDKPVVIAAFEGWNDAGESASGLVRYLRTLWQAEQVGFIDPEDYYDYQVNRPRVRSSQGAGPEIDWPTTRLYGAVSALGGRDVVLIEGIEPSMRWRTFTAELLSFLDQVDASMLVLAGALLADTPHTRPCPVTAHSVNPHLSPRLGLTPSTYRGPTGIVGVLSVAAHQVSLPEMSLWASVPHYGAGKPCHKGTVALLERLGELLQVPLDPGHLIPMATLWEREITDMTEDDEEMAEYVTALEHAQDTADSPEASGDAIAAEFERYLRRRREDGPPAGPGGP